MPTVNVPSGLSTRLKHKMNTSKTAQATGISARGEGQGCGDPSRTETQLYHKKCKLRS